MNGFAMEPYEVVKTIDDLLRYMEIAGRLSVLMNENALRSPETALDWAYHARKRSWDQDGLWRQPCDFPSTDDWNAWLDALDDSGFCEFELFDRLEKEDEDMDSPIGSQSAMRLIWSSLSGEPYDREDVRAKADPDRYVFEEEMSAWSDDYWRGREPLA